MWQHKKHHQPPKFPLQIVAVLAGSIPNIVQASPVPEAVQPHRECLPVEQDLTMVELAQECKKREQNVSAPQNLFVQKTCSLSSQVLPILVRDSSGRFFSKHKPSTN